MKRRSKTAFKKLALSDVKKLERGEEKAFKKLAKIDMHYFCSHIDSLNKKYYFTLCFFTYYDSTGHRYHNS